MSAAPPDAARSLDTPTPAPPAAPSAGLKTPEGKAVSARNAVTHGLHAKETVLPHLGESQAEYDALRDGLARELRPRTAIERHYVQQIAQAMWRLRRLTRWEAGLYDDPALTDEERITRLARVLRHDAALRALRDGPTICQNEPAPAILPLPPAGETAVGARSPRPHVPEGVRICQNEPPPSLPQRHSPVMIGPFPIPLSESPVRMGEGWRSRGGGLPAAATEYCQNELPSVTSPSPPRAGALRRAKKLQHLQMRQKCQNELGVSQGLSVAENKRDNHRKECGD